MTATCTREPAAPAVLRLVAAISELDVTLCAAAGLMRSAADRLALYETDSAMAAELHNAADSCQTALRRAAAIQKQRKQD